MFGAVQFGLMAACVVLFVPMGMAGWHLSRNKVLFFSGALFITLAIGVHLTPYFPSISDFVSTAVVSQNRDSCISSLHNIVWVDRTVEPSWAWTDSRPVAACGFQKLGRSDASDLLNGSWVVIAGDSQARLLTLSLLNLVLSTEEMELVRDDLFKRHSDYQIVIDGTGMKLDFIWAPYVSNLTDILIQFKRSGNYPDVLVMASGLWHMLHFTNSSDYGFSLQLLRNSMVKLLQVSPELGSFDGPVTGSVSIRSPHLFWLGMPMLINSLLNTEEKKEKMDNVTVKAYDRKLYESKLLRQDGGPFLLLDFGSLSRGCGVRCTVDGMHYDRAVYDAAVHVMLNALLIESHQRL